MREAVTDAQQRPGFPLRSLRSLQREVEREVGVSVQILAKAQALSVSSPTIFSSVRFPGLQRE